MKDKKIYSDFIKLHERKLMTKEIDSLDNELTGITNRASSVLGEQGGEELNKAVVALHESLAAFQKVLVKHELYDVI